MTTAPSGEWDRYVHPDEARTAAFRRVYENHLVVEDIYPALARRFAADGVRRFAEVGGGRGPISVDLQADDVETVVLDLDGQMTAEAPRPSVRADLRALPVAAGSFDGMAAINCLYFVDDATEAMRELRRALAPDALFCASSPSRWNDPELEGIDPGWGRPSSFDSDEAPDLVAQVFDVIEVETWRAVAYVLPDRQAIEDYLHAFDIEGWADKARAIDPPLRITKVGAHVWARA